MITTILLILLGFFIAGFLALLLAPLVWRRAVRLTTKRIEASLPLSANELEAEKDRLRASHAMAARRLEMNIENLNRKTSSQLVELARLSDEARQLAEERDAQDRVIADLRDETEKQRAALAENAAIISTLETRLDEAVSELEVRGTALMELNDRYEEERLLASSRQIEMVARETELRKVEDDLAELRRDRKNAIRAGRDAEAARKEAEAGLKVAEKRNADLQKKMESQMRALYENEEKLERREAEIARLRKEMNAASEASLSDQATRRLMEAEAESDRLSRELADKSLQLRTLLADAGGRTAAPAKSSEAEQDKLKTRISRLLQENKKLRGELSERKRNGKAAPARAQAAGQSDDALREQIHSLAAEVVSLTAALEGGDTPIADLLKQEEAAGEGRPLSLAERVRTLRDRS
ncbi:hypothetical protein A33O_16647 [Nitratireductor aquibiodomus RA22]|uniref:Uncharacterized protein n=2 Tax=Nitratireductor aquibiodomus TaxID=204799 RepID=A0A1H4JA60_9HYPH|nr:hypothetical protein [Nitratireductor aquibiodomus]EIM73260.1 hypothetical protein A33O_16647 [Nitratireductor aquibiodomus RA22]SEB43200.1 hypothetical protein SAMN05216452_1172 [Nitratireductor aquibiodomus]